MPVAFDLMGCYVCVNIYIYIYIYIYIKMNSHHGLNKSLYKPTEATRARLLLQQCIGFLLGSIESLFSYVGPQVLFNFSHFFLF
uniref:Uncharacterized protein n=1 Tax=Aquilaria malaccensis TaxID=223753 RepID=A0A4Y6GLP9_9ROSI|nr:hypothetical protein [Aquilaria malaccensis]